jgi:hypothetical protein
MKRLFTFLGTMVFVVGSAIAQEVNSSVPLSEPSFGEDGNAQQVVDYTPLISIDSRFGYDRVVSGGPAGFGGDGLYLNIDGKISKNLSYSLCQRFFSSQGDDDSAFDNTDWLTLSYEVGSFSFTAGKDVVMVGSFEYDAYDIDSYFDMNSMFYNTFGCYQWGVKAAWTPSEERSIALQVTNSPFSFYPREDNLYAYNLAWSDGWDCYSSLWSVNMFEYEHGKFVKCIALGNMFYIGNLSLGLDCIALDANLKDRVDDQLTINFMPSYEFGNKFRLFGKLGWERVGEDLPYDFTGEYLSAEDMALANEENIYTLPAFLVAGQDYWFYGAGLEYFPIKDNDSVRLHAVWASNNFTNRHSINIGLTWKFDVVGAIKHVVNRRK